MSTNKSALYAQAAELEKSSKKVLEHAKKRGADRAKIAANCSIERRLVIENKEFTLANTLETQKFGILVHKDQKKGSASLNNTNPTSLEASVDDALTLAKFGVADEFLTMPDNKEAPPAAKLNFMFDDKLAETGLGELQEFAQSVLTRLTRDKRVSLDKVEFGISTSWHGLYNSLGVAQSESQTAVSWSFFGMAVDGEEVSGFDYDGRASYTWNGALDLALKDADRFAEKIVSNLRPQKAASYKGPVLLSPRAVEEVLLGTLFYHAAGSSVMDNKSRWAKDIGNQVISKMFTMTDNPHDRQFTGATSFDGDGLPTRPHTLFSDGRLMMHLHDCYSAKRTGAKSTATSGGPFALTIASGTGDLSAMRNIRSELLVVDRFSGNIDPVKGDFSGVAKSSRMLKGGQDAGAVTETMIAGNLFEVLNNILNVSRDQELISGAMMVPWILVDGVSVSGS